MFLNIVLGLTLAAPPELQFTVTNRMPAFTVTNHTFVVAPPKLDPTKPAPAGYEWQRWPGEDWKLVKVAATSGVVVQPPFVPGSASAHTLSTGAPNVVTNPRPEQVPGSRWELTPTAHIPTTVRGAGVAARLLSGSTRDNCPPGQL